MGLNLLPAPTQVNPMSSIPTGGPVPLDLNFGPAPAASAAPTVSTGGTVPGMTTGVGLSPDVASNWSVPTNVPTGQSLSQGMQWGQMPFMDKAKTVLGGIGMLGQIWSAFQANKIARDSLDFQKKAFKTNLSNQRSSYNMALEDRATARYAQMERPGDAAAYIEKHRLGG